MKSKIDKYLFELTDKLAFLSLEETRLEGFKNAPDDFAIPVFVQDIRALAGGSDGFSTKQIAQAMLYIIGIDPGFRFNDIYIDFLKKVIDKPEALATELGMEKYNLKSYKDALIFLRAAMVLNDSEIYPVFNYSHIAFEFAANTNDQQLALDLYEEAKAGYSKVIELNPDEPYANFQLGLMLSADGETVKAAEFLDKAYRYGSADIREKSEGLLKEVKASTKLDLAEEAIDQGHYQEVLNILDEVSIKALPAELKYKILYAKGFASKALGQIEEAINYYAEALTISNRDSLLLAELGMAYALIGDFDQSLELYLSALDLEKDSIELLNNIAIIYLNLNDISKAKEYIAYAKELDPSEDIVDETIKLIRTIEENQGSI